MRVRVLYTGRVQGVGFRATTREIARRHPVTGWVMNLSDGRVQLEAQGGASDVEGFLADVAERLGGGIESQDHAAVPSVEGEASFEIRRS